MLTTRARLSCDDHVASRTMVVSRGECTTGLTWDPPGTLARAHIGLVAGRRGAARCATNLRAVAPGQAGRALTVWRQAA